MKFSRLQFYLRAHLLGILAFTILISNATASTLRCSVSFLEARTELNNDSISTNAFQVSRGLEAYSLHFPVHSTGTLKQTVLGLNTDSVWVDMGAGRAKALTEGLVANQNIALGLGISFKKPEDTETGTGLGKRFLYIDGDYVENFARDGRLDAYFGKVGLITDVYGPLSYTDDLIGLLQVYVDLLKKDGISFFNIMIDRNFENNSEGMHKTENLNHINSIYVGGAYDMDALPRWLTQIVGIEVLSILPMKAEKNGLFERSFAIKIRKARDHVVIPKTLILRSYSPDAPPKRVYDLSHASSTK